MSPHRRRPSRTSSARTSAWRLALVATLAAACGTQTVAGPLPGGGSAGPSPSPTPSKAAAAPVLPNLLPGMPPPLQANDVYAATRLGLAPAVRSFPELVYVPNGLSNTVSVVNPRTAKVIGTYPAGVVPQHVVPSYDLRTLWVNSSTSNTLTRMDPATGRALETIPVADPYNLYFTPDGKDAVVMAERLQRIDFRDPHTMRLKSSLATGCDGVNHVDFSADGRSFVATCEFSGNLLLIDTVGRRVVKRIALPPGSKPQDVKLSPDGSTYFVADLNRNGLVVLNAARFVVTGFIPTGAGAHGLYTSRDSKDLYVTNRGAGTVSVLDLATRKVRVTYRLPNGASPDMGNLSVDGRTFWLSSRYGEDIYALDMRTGRTTATVRVGRGPHGLTVYPQPGRYSLGHTGIMR